MGDDIPYLPNKRGGGVCIGGKIAPIFFNTMEDSGALPIEMDVTTGVGEMGRVIVSPQAAPFLLVIRDSLMTECCLLATGHQHQGWQRD